MKVQIGRGTIGCCLALLSAASLILVLLWIWADLEYASLAPGLAMACLPVPLYVGLALWIDRFDPEPPVLLLGAFLWGACLAVMVSYVVNTFNLKLFYHGSGDLGTAVVMAHIVSAPFVEEICKGMGLLLLVYFRRQDFDGVVDGVVYATLIALGFAMAENIQYYGQSYQDGVEAGTFLARGIMSPFAHPLFTCMTGIGLGLVCESERLEGKWRVAAGLALAMGLHATWNLAALIHHDLWLATYLLIMLPCAMGVATVAASALGRESSWLRLYLAKEIPDPVVLGEVSSIWGRYRFALRHILNRDLRRWRSSQRFLRVASQLAFLRYRQHQRGLRPESGREEALMRQLFALQADLSSQFSRP